MSGFAHPEVLVTSEWVRENAGKSGVRLVEIDVDTKAYEAGHIPGAIAFNWQTELQDQVHRDIISKASFEKLLSGAGIKNDDTVVLYGDNNNWFAAYGFWLFKIYGHRDVRLLDGGRVKWLADESNPLTVDVPEFAKSKYAASEPDGSLRARAGEVLERGTGAQFNLVDVRSPDEFTGKVIAPPGMNETAQRGGHVPGARNVPWSTAVNGDGTFKPADELARIYFEQAGVDRSKRTIAYCRIGERSSHTWFVLKYLLGLSDVKNYDGSWTEYGNLIGVPVEKGA